MVEPEILLFYQELEQCQQSYEERLSQKETESLARVNDLTIEANKQNEENQQQVSISLFNMVAMWSISTLSFTNLQNQ